MKNWRPLKLIFEEDDQPLRREDIFLLILKKYWIVYLIFNYDSFGKFLLKMNLRQKRQEARFLIFYSNKQFIKLHKFGLKISLLTLSFLHNYTFYITESDQWSARDNETAMSINCKNRRPFYNWILRGLPGQWHFIEHVL